MENASHRSSDFIKHVFTLISGTAIAQLIPIILSPFLRRWISLEDYALFEVFFRLISILSIVVALRYPMAVVLPKDDKEANNVVGAALLSSLSINALIFVIICFFMKSIGYLINIPSDSYYVLFFVPLGAFLISACNTFNYWLIRKKAFKASSINKVVHKTSESGFWVLFTFLKVNTALVYGDILARAAWLLFALKQSISNGFSFRQCSLSSIKHMMLHYKEYPLYNTLPALLNVASLMLPVIFINKLYNEAITSNMGLCMQVLGLPLALISTAVSQVFYQKAVEFKNKELSIIPFLKPLVARLGGLALIGLVLAYFLSEPLFALIYGADYIMAGEFAVIIVFAFALKFIVSPLSMIFPALDKIKVSSLWQCIYFAMICSLLFFPELDIYQFLYIYLGIELVAYSLHALLIFRVIGAYEKNR